MALNEMEKWRIKRIYKEIEFCQKEIARLEGNIAVLHDELDGICGKRAEGDRKCTTK